MVGVDGAGDRQLTDATGDYSDGEWSPDGARLVAIRCRRNHGGGPGGRERRERRGRRARRRRALVVPPLDRQAEIVATYEDPTPPERRRWAHGLHSSTPPRRPGPACTPRRARGGLFSARATASRSPPSSCARGPHRPRPPRRCGLPARRSDDGLRGRVGRSRAILRRQGIRVAGCPTSAARTAYGSDFERMQPRRLGRGDTTDCLAAPDYLRTLDWVDGDRSGSSAPATARTWRCWPDRRPAASVPCGVPKYGDSDIVTSWAMGDREGVLDLERMMGTPAHRARGLHGGSAFHRLENVEVPC